MTLFSPSRPSMANRTMLSDTLSLAETVSPPFAAEIPFWRDDVTIGLENEFQVAVEGARDDVDLAQSIIASKYYTNLKLRTARGDLAPRVLAELDGFLNDRRNQIWENSWVRFPRHLLGKFASAVFAEDLRADKANPESRQRADAADFHFSRAGEVWLRVPVSYLLKLSLAKALDCPTGSAEPLRTTGSRMMTHLICDNCSPEVTSFVITNGRPEVLPGRAAAAEVSRQYFFLQLLVQFANQSFGLRQYGQTCRMYLAPNPPARQKHLNDLISDQFYRELFLNPCLSGWDRGEAKKEYMALCHQTLSRSQLNTIAKLREAGIIVNNLVVLPNTSSTSLANNGTHITLGSRSLGPAYAQPGGSAREKSNGDLVIKIVEHFLPLFVTAYSAAPYRLDFCHFHPEKALGYLPHELDYTHLRMLWRRWKKKAAIGCCGHSFTPVGPLWLDRLTSGLLRLPGDYLPDVRLIDYLVALHSLDQSPALNGREGNQEQLQRDLFEMGVFDPRMAIYLPYRLRPFARYGFTGFEGRHYSLFPDLEDSVAGAVNLQVLVTALAYRWVSEGLIKHHHIPDDPHTESERRQLFFAAAIGVPTVFIRADNRNLLMRRILALVERQRPSRRYRGYLRVEVGAYRRACLTLLTQESAPFVQTSGVREELEWLEHSLAGSKSGAAGQLTRALLNHQGIRSEDPLRVPAKAFNQAAEQYYRHGLRHRHTIDGLQTLIADGRELENATDPMVNACCRQLLGAMPPGLFIRETGRRVLAEEATADELQTFILLVVLIIHLQTIEHAA